VGAAGWAHSIKQVDSPKDGTLGKPGIPHRATRGGSKREADPDALLDLFDTAVHAMTSTSSPNRAWSVLAPRAVEAGFCALRATGWFDDRESGIDVFAPNAFLDNLEIRVRETVSHNANQL
jgi:hypothetical protein